VASTYRGGGASDGSTLAVPAASSSDLASAGMPRGLPTAAMPPKSRHVSVLVATSTWVTSMLVSTLTPICSRSAIVV